MNEHIGEGGEGSFIINALVRIETFVLNADESVSYVLGNILNIYRYSLNVVFNRIELNQLFVALIGVYYGVCAAGKLGNGNVGSFVHEFQYVNCHCRCDYCTGYDDYQEYRQQRSSHYCRNFFCQRRLFIFRLFPCRSALRARRSMLCRRICFSGRSSSCASASAFSGMTGFSRGA